jgi:hypothetical protein
MMLLPQGHFRRGRCLVIGTGILFLTQELTPLILSLGRSKAGEGRTLRRGNLMRMVALCAISISLITGVGIPIRISTPMCQIRQEARLSAGHTNRWVVVDDPRRSYTDAA